jgi:hypothetical protein
MKLAAAASLVLIACGAPARTQPAGERGCPPAASVALASWHVDRLHGGATYPGSPKVSTWLVELGYRAGDADDAPDPGPIERYEIAKLGLGPLPDDVWLLRPGLAPCAARITGYVAERLDTPAWMRISAVLAGCPGPIEDDDWQLAWVSFDGAEPAGCRVLEPIDRGERLGVRGPAFDFTIPPLTAETTLPDRWDAVLDPPCDGCQTLWRLDATDGDPAIAELTVSDVEPIVDACAIVHHDHHGFYAVPEKGAPVAIPLGPDLQLVGALADARGVHVVLAAGIDSWAVYDVDADGVTGFGRTVQVAPPDDDNPLWSQLVPGCDR